MSHWRKGGITLSLLKELLPLKVGRISIFHTSDLIFFCLGLRYRTYACVVIYEHVSPTYGHLSRVTYMRG